MQILEIEEREIIVSYIESDRLEFCRLLIDTTQPHHWNVGDLILVESNKLLE